MAKKRDNAWMAFYPGDYLRDTMHLSTEQHGAYLLLLLHCWMNDGTFEDDDDQLANITRLGLDAWARSRRVLLAFFKRQEDGTLVHERILRERTKAKDITQKRRAAGKGGAEKRWQMPSASDADATESGSQNDAHQHQHQQSPNGDSVGAPSAPPTAAPEPPPPPPPAPPPPAPPPEPEKPAAARGTRLPKDWTLPPEWQDIGEALRPDLNILTVADSFRDYWVSKSGKDATKLDWLATWRNWVRNQRGAYSAPAGRQERRQATLNGLGTQGAQHADDRGSTIDGETRWVDDGP